jgi:hypothetical protein
LPTCQTYDSTVTRATLVNAGKSANAETSGATPVVREALAPFAAAHTKY